MKHGILGLVGAWLVSVAAHALPAVEPLDEMALAEVAGSAYADAYRAWWRSRDSTRTVELLMEAEAVLAAADSDPLGLRLRVASGLLRAHASRRDAPMAAHYARVLAGLVAADLPDDVPPTAEAVIEFAVDSSGQSLEPRVIHASPPSFGEAMIAAMDDSTGLADGRRASRRDGFRIAVGIPTARLEPDAPFVENTRP